MRMAHSIDYSEETIETFFTMTSTGSEIGIAVRIALQIIVIILGWCNIISSLEVPCTPHYFGDGRSSTVVIIIHHFCATG